METNCRSVPRKEKLITLSEGLLLRDGDSTLKSPPEKIYHSWEKTESHEWHMQEISIRPHEVNQQQRKLLQTKMYARRTTNHNRGAHSSHKRLVGGWSLSMMLTGDRVSLTPKAWLAGLVVCHDMNCDFKAMVMSVYPVVKSWVELAIIIVLVSHNVDSAESFLQLLNHYEIKRLAQSKLKCSLDPKWVATTFSGIVTSDSVLTKVQNPLIHERMIRRLLLTSETSCTSNRLGIPAAVAHDWCMFQSTRKTESLWADSVCFLWPQSGGAFRDKRSSKNSLHSHHRSSSTSSSAQEMRRKRRRDTRRRLHDDP